MNEIDEDVTPEQVNKLDDYNSNKLDQSSTKSVIIWIGIYQEVKEGPENDNWVKNR